MTSSGCESLPEVAKGLNQRALQVRPLRMLRDQWLKSRDQCGERFLRLRWAAGLNEHGPEVRLEDGQHSPEYHFVGPEADQCLSGRDRLLILLLRLARPAQRTQRLAERV